LKSACHLAWLTDHFFLHRFYRIKATESLLPLLRSKSTDPEPALRCPAGLRLSKNPLSAGPLDAAVCCEPEAAGQIGGLGFIPLPGC